MPRSRAVLSLLGFCYYQQNDFLQAASTYNMLCRVCPNVEDYRINEAKSLIKAGSPDEAERVLSTIRSQAYSQEVASLRVFLNFEEDNLHKSKSYLGECLTDSDTLIADATILYKEELFEEARERFYEASQYQDYHADVSYGLALCEYKLGDNEAALAVLHEIIQTSLEKYPHLAANRDSDTNDEELKPIQNTTELEDSFFIEAYNLKATIEYELGDFDQAKQSLLLDMPFRVDEDLDAITLQNHAILNMNSESDIGFQKLNFLLSNPPFPVETFSNLLLLYCQYRYYDLAGDILAENVHLMKDLLSQDLIDFLDASVLLNTSPEDAFVKFETLSKQRVDRLRKIRKDITNFKSSGSKDDIKGLEADFDNELKQYIPILMATCGIFWDKGKFKNAETLLRESADICKNNKTWQLNIAHTFFMSDSQYEEAIKYYSPILDEIKREDILQIPSIILANLCVSYIMSNRNEEAEEVIKSVEKVEGKTNEMIEEKHQYHHGCIINLCIGTLYCSKKNFEFGISRICKSLDPMEIKLTPDTWYYCKRCFLSLAEFVSKNMITISDNLLQHILLFLNDAMRFGRKVPTTVDKIAAKDPPEESQNDVYCEAKLLKKFFVKLL